ncbi:MAG: ATP-binding protein [Candidatus Aenigmatarchaeota archaeon]
MREEDFKVVLSRWKSFEMPELIEREIKIPLEPTTIVSIIGPRQAGKTYRMLQAIKDLSKIISKENILYVNFEHERLRNLDAKNLEDMMKVFYQIFTPDEKSPIYLFFDEIQNVRDWDKWIRRIYDSGKFRIFISGSSSKLLAKEIATSLRGRSIDFVIFPFNFREFLKAKKFEIGDIKILSYLEERGKILRLAEEFVKFGGYPKVVLTEDYELKEKILESYYEAIFYKDLVERYKLDPVLLDNFLRYAITCFSKQLSISKIFNYLKSIGLKCSKSTLIKFLKYAEEIFFLFPIEIFSFSIKEKRQYPKKFHVVDNGIIRAIYPEAEESFGRLIENCVAIELLRRKYAKKIEINYWREYGKRDGSEVDFVIKEGLEIKQLIQVTYASNKDEIEKREIRALIKASEQLKCKDLLIITWDYEDEINVENKTIKCIPLWKWLLRI